jgi:hypothetical protein
VGAPRLLFPDQNLFEIQRNINLSNKLRSNINFSVLPAKLLNTLQKRQLLLDFCLIITRKHS